MVKCLVIGFCMLYQLCAVASQQCSADPLEHKQLERAIEMENQLIELEKVVDERIQKVKEATLVIEANNEKIAAELADLENATVTGNIHAIGGTTYVRWGRKVCSNDTGAELVYEGYVAGGHYSHKGAGANDLCLPKDPLFVDKINGGSGNYLFGAQYEMPQNQNEDVPCAVCRTPRTNVLMIPGRNQCYDKWQLEYHGMLVSSAYNNVAQKRYVCLDSEPEILENGSKDLPNAIFYYVDGSCGSLKCPPYIHAREITCAVCTYTGSTDNVYLHTIE